MVHTEFTARESALLALEKRTQTSCVRGYFESLRRPDISFCKIDKNVPIRFRSIQFLRHQILPLPCVDTFYSTGKDDGVRISGVPPAADDGSGSSDSRSGDPLRNRGFRVEVFCWFSQEEG